MNNYLKRIVQRK